MHESTRSFLHGTENNHQSRKCHVRDCPDYGERPARRAIVQQKSCVRLSPELLCHKRTHPTRGMPSRSPSRIASGVFRLAAEFLLHRRLVSTRRFGNALGLLPLLCRELILFLSQRDSVYVENFDLPAHACSRPAPPHRRSSQLSAEKHLEKSRLFAA